MQSVITVYFLFLFSLFPMGKGFSSLHNHLQTSQTQQVVRFFKSKNSYDNGKSRKFIQITNKENITPNNNTPRPPTQSQSETFFLGQRCCLLSYEDVLAEKKGGLMASMALLKIKAVYYVLLIECITLLPHKIEFACMINRLTSMILLNFSLPVFPHE